MFNIYTNQATLMSSHAQIFHEDSGRLAADFQNHFLV